MYSNFKTMGEILINGFNEAGLQLLAKKFNVLVKQKRLLGKFILGEKANFLINDLVNFLGNDWSSVWVRGEAAHLRKLFSSETILREWSALHPDEHMFKCAVNDMVGNFNTKTKFYGLKVTLDKPF